MYIRFRFKIYIICNLISNAKYTICIYTSTYMPSCRNSMCMRGWCWFIVCCWTCSFCFFFLLSYCAILVKLESYWRRKYYDDELLKTDFACREARKILKTNVIAHRFIDTHTNTLELFTSMRQKYEVSKLIMQ